MKMKLILSFLLASILAAPTTDLYAQTRKTTGARKTATTGTRKTTVGTKKTRASSAKTLNKKEIDGHEYYGIWAAEDLTQIGKNFGFYNKLKFDSNGDSVWIVLGNYGTAQWTVSGSTLKITNGPLLVSLTSANGKDFKGQISTNGVPAGDFWLYQIKSGKLTPETIKASLDSGKFKALIQVGEDGGGATMFPVMIKTTPNEDGTGGTYEFSADNGIGLGLVKGTYTYTEKGVKFSSNLRYGDNESEAFVSWRGSETMSIRLGKKYIDGLGNESIYLNLFNQ